MTISDMTEIDEQGLDDAVGLELVSITQDKNGEERISKIGRAHV